MSMSDKDLVQVLRDEAIRRTASGLTGLAGLLNQAADRIARAALAAKAKKRKVAAPRKRRTKDERRFLALVKREVEDTITDSELVELDRLEVKRADFPCLCVARAVRAVGDR